jgi:formyltetrahydrofolate deformylase
MRIEWELEGFVIARDAIGAKFAPIANRFGMDWSLRFSDFAPRTAIFVSKFDHCLYDLLLRWKAAEFRAEIPVIVSNHRDLEGVAKYFGVPFEYFEVTPDNKANVETRQIELLKKLDIDVVILARYMQILGEKFVKAFPNRIINIHHSFLPAFVGAKPYHQAHSRGVKIIRATSHYVTAELDKGPIIEQDVARVSHRDSIHDLIEKGQNLEKTVLARAVKLHLENKVLIFGNKTVVFD